MSNTADTISPEQAYERAAALTYFLDTFDGHTAYDVGPHLTCREADAMADFLRAYGQPDTADALIEGHAAEDEEGDAHYEEDDADN